jgi:hypothetical protein
MMSFFIQKKNMYLHQYLFLNFLYSTIISIIFFSMVIQIIFGETELLTPL